MRWYAGLLTLLLAAAVTTAWLTSRGVPDGLADLDPSPAPVSVEAVRSAIDFDSEATLSATQVPGPSLLATGISGTVTSVAVAEGDVVGPGSPLYQVNGISIHAYSGAVLYRPLSAGDSGEDVRSAQALLAATEPAWQVRITGTVDAVTLKAIAAYAERVGAGRKITSLNPEWFVHLPSRKYALRQITLVVGAPAPAAGSPFAGTRPSFTQITLSSPSAGPEGSYHFVSSGSSVPVTKQAGTWAVSASDPLLALLAAQPTDAAAGSTITLAGRVRLSVPAEGIAIPGASLMTGPDGSQCVVSDSAPPQPIRVVVRGSDVSGMAQLDSSSLAVGTRILVNPTAVHPELTCPSN